MSNKLNKKKIILLILDGWGYKSKYHGNAIKQARTPTFDFLWHNYPKTLLNASENHVGLPNNQVGNSEVGHTIIGAGRIIDQALVRISKSIKNGSFFNNQILNNLYKKNKTIHLIGLCSDGGVHSHIDHLIELLNISQNYKNVQTCIHIITDGRDTHPKSAKKFIFQLVEYIKDKPNIIISTISGRYYSMDRDCRWERTEKIYNCLIDNTIDIKYRNDIFKFINDNYQQNVYDEFLVPTRVNKGNIKNDDGIIFFNFRPDRMRQLLQAFCIDNFTGFKTQPIKNLKIATFTVYDSQLNPPIIFSKITMNNFLGKIISKYKMKQLRLAETEKYAHVTYFFNGGREEPFPGEDRALIPSPQVETYDSTPQMSALDITSKLIELHQTEQYSIIIVNYANPDMLGHTGHFSSTKKAIENVDKCLNNILKRIDNNKTITIITADHGNAETMLDKNNDLCKSHTKNLVPFILVNNDKKIRNIKMSSSGSLADIAPTILDLFNIDKPNEMDGQSLINNKSK